MYLYVPANGDQAFCTPDFDAKALELFGGRIFRLGQSVFEWKFSTSVWEPVAN